MTLQITQDRPRGVAELIALHGREGLVDPQTLRIDLEAYRPVGRLFANLYARQREIFELRRETFVEWRVKRGKAESA